MPIKIPDDLPARRTLEEEGVRVISEDDAMRQDVRPLKIALLNLMPDKIKTETQITRLVGATPLQIEMTLLSTSSYTPRNTSAEHMLAFYQPWEAVREQKFDGLIITGAPIEKLPFEEVIYWPELHEIFDWTQTNVHDTFNICWAGQAALYHFYGINKRELPKKRFGLYDHTIVTPNSVMLRGFPDVFPVPISRYTEVCEEEIPNDPNLRILAASAEAGVCLIRDHKRHQVYMFNHLEYDTATLGDEYRRDAEVGEKTALPVNYFPNDDPKQPARNQWRGLGHLLIGNWINDLYQTTPFDIDRIRNGPP